MNANIPIPRTTIATACEARGRALRRMGEAADALSAAYAIQREADKIAEGAHMGARFYAHTDSESRAFKALYPRSGWDREASLEAYRKDLDSRVWTRLLDMSGMRTMMDREAIETLETSLAAEVPPATEENVRATLEGLFRDADMIFKRGLTNAFCKLDRRFRSHDGFKIGRRIILERVFDDWGSFNYHSKMEATIMDVERVFAVLNGEPPQGGQLIAAIKESRGRGLDPRQSECESRYFRIKGFKNGNAHLWFTRDDLVVKANKVLAEFYGDVLPDAFDEGTGDHLFTGTNVAADLQFYRSPPGIVDLALDNIRLRSGDRVLEPSAGDGAIVGALLAKGASVHAIEVDERRARVLRAMRLEIEERGLSNGATLHVDQANFLTVKPHATFHAVVMNPPFYGTHWMNHVRHAFDFLAPGGRLRAILPASAEVNEGRKHEAFRKWALPFSDRNWRGPFSDLPAEAFADQGVRINTVLLQLRKPL